MNFKFIFKSMSCTITVTVFYTVLFIDMMSFIPNITLNYTGGDHSIVTVDLVGWARMFVGLDGGTK